MLFIIANASLSFAAKTELERHGIVLWFQSSGITYPAVANHPDIFIAQTDNQLVVAPNTPQDFIEQLKSYNIPFVYGEKLVGIEYPYTAHYNACISNNILIHNLKLTDSSIHEKTKQFRKIHVRQGYTRCSCIVLNSQSVITSDEGIYATLKKEKFDVVFINPKQILLEGQKHGFIGGTAGKYSKTLFFCGDISTLAEYTILKECISQKGYNTVELCNTQLTDVGSMFFVEK